MLHSSVRVLQQTVLFGSVLSVAGQVVDAVKGGKLKYIFVIGG
jgi:hydroxylamine reductase (hybrid-cluster protein)